MPLTGQGEARLRLPRRSAGLSVPSALVLLVAFSAFALSALALIPFAGGHGAAGYSIPGERWPWLVAVSMIAVWSAWALGRRISAHLGSLAARSEASVTLDSRLVELRALAAALAEQEQAGRAEAQRLKSRAQLARDELRESEAKFRAFMDNSPFRAWITDASGRFVFLNRAAVGPDSGDGPLGKTRRECYSPEVAERMERADRAVLDSDAPRTEIEQVSESGLLREYLTVRFPIRGDGVRCVGGTSIDLTDQRSAERALEEADRQKDLFLSALARALRNPLAPIRNALSLQRRDDLTADMVGWTAGIIESEVGRMARLIEELLDMSRVTRNRLVLRIGSVRLNEAVERAVAAARTEAVEEREQTLAVTLPREDVELRADRARLCQALALVLRYAAKRSTAGGNVRLEARVAGEVAMIAVRYGGAPLRADELERLFDVFRQSDGTSPETGLDVELPLARELIRLHGGSLTAFADPGTAGNRFEIRLPIAAVATPREAAPGPIADVLPMGPRRRVLIADDSLRTASSLAMLLKMSGHEVRTASNGEEAVDAARSFLPDVALLDIDMPKMNGYDAARRIRELWPEGGPFLVAVTSWGDDDSRERAIGSGFDLHYTKPVDPGQVLRLLASPRLSHPDPKASIERV